MTWIDHWEMAWEALTSHKLRSVLAVIGVAIAVAAVVGLSAVSTGSREAIVMQLTSYGAKLYEVQYGTPRRGSATDHQLITVSDVAALRHTFDRIEKIVPQIVFRSPFKVADQSGVLNITGTTADALETTGMHVSEGRWFRPEDDRQAVVVIGAQIAQDIFGRQGVSGDVVYLDGRPYDIIGVVARAGGFVGSIAPTTQVYIPLMTAQRISGQRDYTVITVIAADASLVADLRDRSAELLRSRHPGFDFRTYVVEHSADDIKEVFDILTKVIIAVTSISLLIGGIGVTNIMLVSVTERTREIGIRKAIGATRRHIFNQFLAEAVLVSLAGGAVGLATAAIVVYMMGRFWFNLDLGLPLYAVGLALLVSVGTGLVTGVYPALRATAMHPVEALRFE